MSLFEKASLLITGIGLWNCTLFCVVYHIHSKGLWKSNEVGRYLMLGAACLGSLFALIISARFFGEWPGRRLVTFILYVGYVGFTAWLLRLLYLVVMGRMNIDQSQKDKASSGSSTGEVA